MNANDPSTLHPTNTKSCGCRRTPAEPRHLTFLSRLLHLGIPPEFPRKPQTSYLARANLPKSTHVNTDGTLCWPPCAARRAPGRSCLCRPSAAASACCPPCLYALYECRGAWCRVGVAPARAGLPLPPVVHTGSNKSF